jgi:predicted ArsR family transcriptional regulator
MTTTRDQILQNLLNHRRCTIKDLAESLQINPISVRHHISRLEADGFIIYEEERHGVGRPRRMYFLSAKGLELFPTRYVRLTTRLLEQLKGNLPEDVIEGLFTKIATDLAEDYVSEVDLGKLSFEERITLLEKLLVNEGFTIEVERTADNYIIKEISCPYYHIGQEHPEVCLLDATVIAKVMSIPAAKVGSMLNDDSYCTFTIPIAEAKGNIESIRIVDEPR